MAVFVFDVKVEGAVLVCCVPHILKIRISHIFHFRPVQRCDWPVRVPNGKKVRNACQPHDERDAEEDINKQVNGCPSVS